jgi:hypothetical protein
MAMEYDKGIIIDNNMYRLGPNRQPNSFKFPFKMIWVRIAAIPGLHIQRKPTSRALPVEIIVKYHTELIAKVRIIKIQILRRVIDLSVIIF